MKTTTNYLFHLHQMDVFGAMKKMVITLVLCLPVSATCYAASPDDGNRLYVFTNTTSTASAYSLDDIDKITFTDNAVQVWRSKAATDYVYDRFRFITFNDKVVPTAIERVEQDEPLNVEKLNAAEGIYDLQGRKLNSLQHGLNIIRMSDGTTRKVIVK